GREAWERLFPACRQSAVDASLKIRSQVWVGSLVAAKQVVPAGLLLLSNLAHLAKVRGDVLRNSESLLWVEAELLLDLADVVRLQRRAVHLLLALLQRAEADNSLHLDDGRLISHLLGVEDRLAQAINVVDSLDCL